MSDDIMPMAWNEPGSDDKKENPWGKKPNTNKNGDGPPDLDQIFKSLQEKLKKLFGIKGGKGDGLSNKNNSSLLVKCLYSVPLARSSCSAKLSSVISPSPDSNSNCSATANITSSRFLNCC